MTVIAGAVGAHSAHARSALRALLQEESSVASLRRHGEFSFPPRVKVSAPALFGIALDGYLPEDRFDRQPLRDGPALFVADVRIDNRSEVGDALGLSGPALVKLADAHLLKHAWDRWAGDVVTRVLGDFAFAAWDGRDALTLVRSAFAQRPLLYRQHGDCIAFASLPDGIFALTGETPTPNLAQAASIAAHLPALGTATMFESVHLVPKGCAVRFRGGRTETRRLYDHRPANVRLRTLNEAGEALRAELERATKPLLRRSFGFVAAQLSAGRDSNAVASTAARLMGPGEVLLALTGAPTGRLEAPGGPDRIYDESSFAASTVAAHPAMRHRICRSYRSMDDEMTAVHRLHHAPLYNVANLPWWEEVGRVAAAEGAAVMLTGQNGNYTISGGGPEHLRDLWTEEGTLAWARAITGLSALDRHRWRTNLSTSLGPALPPALFRALLRLSGRPAPVFAPRFLREPYRTVAAEQARAAFGDPRPPGSFFAYRSALMLEADNPEKFSLRRWGVDIRDPTLDRRLIELTFAIPARFLVSARSARPAFEEAFADRIPRNVLRLTRRGYQGADWPRQFPAALLQTMFARYRRNSSVEELVDFKAVDQALEDWPSGGPAIAGELLTILSIANFMDCRFAD